MWLLNEFDLGMARSAQQHTARLFAYALGFNYAWGVEFVELTNGNREEKLRTDGQENRHGLHGNAILSRWPLDETKIVRMPGISQPFTGKGPETAFGHERRLGGRMTLFATTVVGLAGLAGSGKSNRGDRTSFERILLGATHAQTSRRLDEEHTCAVTEGMRTHITAVAATVVAADLAADAGSMRGSSRSRGSMSGSASVGLLRGSLRRSYGLAFWLQKGC